MMSMMMLDAEVALLHALWIVFAGILIILIIFHSYAFHTCSHFSIAVVPYILTHSLQLIFSVKLKII